MNIEKEIVFKDTLVNTCLAQFNRPIFLAILDSTVLSWSHQRMCLSSITPKCVMEKFLLIYTLSFLKSASCNCSWNECVRAY